MSQLLNGQSASDVIRPKSRGTYTGERLKLLRPDMYRELVRLLAEPREHVSIREICRRCHVTDDTVKAIDQREAVPIAVRKQALMEQAARIAKRAYDRVEDQIDEAPLAQATVVAGVMTDKLLLLNNDPTIHLQHSIGQPDRNPNWLYDRFAQLHDRLVANAAGQPLTAQPALPNTETILDSCAGNGLKSGE